MGERKPDPSDLLLPPPQHQSDGDDAAFAAASPSSRYSSCGADSEFDRYCSATSLMGTPSTSSAITLFNDFSDAADFANGFDNFSLGGGRMETNHHDVNNNSDRVRFGALSSASRSLRYGSSGLQLYGDGGDELAMTVLDSSELLGFRSESHDSNARIGSIENSDGKLGRKVETEEDSGLSDCERLEGEDSLCVLGNTNSDVRFEDGLCIEDDGGIMDGLDGFDSRFREKEVEKGEEEGGLSDFEHSEGEGSMYGYGSDGDDERNEYFMARNVRYHEELEARNENPLLINSSVAFGSNDLDDFLLENERFGQGSAMSALFCKKQEKDHVGEGDGANLGSISTMGFASAGQEEKEKGKGKDKVESVAAGENVEVTGRTGRGEPEYVKEKEVGDSPPACCQDQGGDKLSNVTDSCTHASNNFLNTVNPQVQDADTLAHCPITSLATSAIDVDLNPLAEEGLQYKGLNAADGGNMEKGIRGIDNEDSVEANIAQHVKNRELDNAMFKFDHFSDSTVDQSSSNPSGNMGNINGMLYQNLEQIAHPSNVGMRKTLESNSTSIDHLEKSPVVFKTEDFELNELYDEVVQEMEEILLDSMDSPGTRLATGNRLFKPQLSLPSRDGGLTASTSSTDDAYLVAQRPARIDRIEVVGARQKKGDISFSERLVGVKEYTVYRIKVWSGKDQWEVERRYRDFLSLYRFLKTLFTEQGLSLPLPWSSVEKESKLFRSASPDIIAKRSVLIQECLQSIIHTRFFSNPPRALISFLYPEGSHPISLVSNASVSKSSLARGTNIRNFSTLGKTISLIVEIPPNKSVRQLLEAQHYTCAGCHKHFDDRNTMIWDIVQTFGWGKPRLCEYTGQLFCSSCHTNETAVLPARVLHNWDFTLYPVSQMAKSFLDSIHEQPMLCVTAVNPFLLSKVPALLRVMSVRKKIGIMLPYVQCPFRRSINRALGNRRYLLESNDFFALRDLIDLSKGVFAALPVMVENLSQKILEHITDQCLICCDVGVPCSARQDCSDPSSLIFPFQEDEIERCKSCQSVFHARCFRKVTSCPCGTHLRLNDTRTLANRASHQRGSDSTLDLLGRGLSSGLSSRFLSGIFTKDKSEKTREHRDENIILMGSLPNTTL